MRVRLEDVARRAGVSPKTVSRENNIGVAMDEQLAARPMVEHLLSLGHRRIAHLRGPGEIGDLRLAGFRAAMRTAGLGMLWQLTRMALSPADLAGAALGMLLAAWLAWRRPRRG